LNKFAIPTILLATVMVAGMFAFMPVEQATTVHDSILSSIEIRDIYADIDDAADGDSDPVTIDFILVSKDGDAITGLDAADMDAESTAGTDTGVITIGLDVDDAGDGAYRITLTPANTWDAGRTSIVLTATDDDGNSASTLLVVDIP